MQETEGVSPTLQLSLGMIFIHFNGITSHEMGSSILWGFILCCEEPPMFFLLLPAEMDPKAPPEHWAEVGTGQPIPSQISISLQQTAAGLFALLSPPTTTYSTGHCSQPLMDSVPWSAETVESLPHARGVLPTRPRAISPSSPLLHSCARCENQFRHQNPLLSTGSMEK